MKVSKIVSELLMAVAEGKQMQVEGDEGVLWKDATPTEALRAILDEDHCRVKPAMIEVRNLELPKPSEKTTAYRMCYQISIQGTTVGSFQAYFNSNEDLIAAFTSIKGLFDNV